MFKMTLINIHYLNEKVWRDCQIYNENSEIYKFFLIFLFLE